MTTRTEFRGVFSGAAALAIALLLGACGGEKQMRAVAPMAPSESPGRANAQATNQVPNTPTASNVSISEEVLRRSTT
jgi:hypothetical protein